MGPKDKRHINPSVIAVMIALALSACGQSSQPASSDNAGSSASLQQKAEAGNIAAQYELGMSLKKGDKPDKKAAFEWLLKAAEAGNADAMFEVSRSYDESIGVSADKNARDRWLNRAVDMDQPRALITKAMQNGDYRSGKIEIVGTSPEKREENAKAMISLLQRAIGKGEYFAEAALGMSYLFGFNEGKTIVIPQDHSKAIPLLKTAAEHDVWFAQWFLAIAFQYGFGETAVDLDQAKKWWDKLERNANSNEQEMIGRLYLVEDKKEYLSGKNKWRDRKLDFDESNRTAIEWLEKSASQNYLDALIKLAQLYESGDVVSKDSAKAFRYALSAAERGDPWAQRQVIWNLSNGIGVPKNNAEAKKWMDRVVNNKNSTPKQVADAQYLLAFAYSAGHGVDSDDVVAYAWANLAMAERLEDSERQKGLESLYRSIEKRLSRDLLTEAQRLSANWKKGQPMVAMSSETVPSEKSVSDANASPRRETTTATMEKAVVGSAIVVSSNGKLLTNQHVVSGCKEIRIPAASRTATILLGDKANDIALLKMDGDALPVGLTPAVFMDENALKQGEDIVAFGFPLDGYLPAAGNITQGIVSSLSGPFNNSSLIQITAPVQQGNSGGPVLNLKGQVVGVVVGKADAIKVAKLTGDIPQNINFAISGRVAKGFMEDNAVAYEKPGLLSLSKDTTALAEIAKKITVKVECWKSVKGSGEE